METDLKETVISLIPKEQLAFMKYDEGFKEYIVAGLSSRLAERIMGILDREEEIIVRQSDLRVSEYIPLDSVEYRLEIDWSPVVRCKECKYWHREIYNGIEYFNFSSCDLNHGGDGNSFYCGDGKRRDDASD